MDRFEALRYQTRQKCFVDPLSYLTRWTDFISVFRLFDGVTIVQSVRVQIIG